MHLIIALALTILASASGYTEKLNIVQLEDGKLMTEFSFEQIVTRTDSVHYQLFPKAIAEILSTFGVKEMHISFTKGRWRADRYGYGLSPQTPPAPPGAHLYAWLNSSSVDRNWVGLTNTLGGLFCASLNFMGPTVTSEPKFVYDSFEPKYVGDATLRVSSLPREIVCTENLTPWAKLLPCQSKAGLAQLLNGYKLFDANYQSVSLHYIPICQVLSSLTKDADCAVVHHKLLQTVTAVFDPFRTKNTMSLKISKLDWSFESVFDRKLVNECPFSSSTVVDVATKIPDATHFASPGDEAQISSKTARHVIQSSIMPYNIGIQYPNQITRKSLII
jgi:phosphatidylinositol glycan class T